MAKLPAINTVIVALTLICITSLSVNGSSDELIDTIDVNVTASVIESDSNDTVLLTTEPTSPNVTNNDSDDGYDATVVEITDEPPIANVSANITTLESIVWENTTVNNENDSMIEPVSEPVRELIHEQIQTKKLPIKCRDGLILRAWPIENITNGDRFARGLVYFLAMCYLFLGVSIVSDRFMAAIEKITAIEKEVIVRRPDGMKQVVIVRVWNETVANLTLMVSSTLTLTFCYRIMQCEIFTNVFPQLRIEGTWNVGAGDTFVNN